VRAALRVVIGGGGGGLLRGGDWIRRCRRAKFKKKKKKKKKKRNGRHRGKEATICNKKGGGTLCGVGVTKFNKNEKIGEGGVSSSCY